MNNHFPTIVSQAEALIKGESDLIANMANVSALLYNNLSDVNWAGFYRVVEEQLILGPFQGQPACIRIPLGKGVCGTAVTQNMTQLVDDVLQFEGHIFCDAASKSEIVIPIRVDNKVVAVLDIDSPILARFNQNDADQLTKIVDLIENSLQ